MTVVAGTLQKAGLITYHRGHVTIVDREKLEAASCECYRAATDLLKSVTERIAFALSRSFSRMLVPAGRELPFQADDHRCSALRSAFLLASGV